MGVKAVSRLFYYISIASTAVLAVITLTGAFVCNIRPELSALFPFIGLALPVLLLINLAVLIYWTVRWRYWVIIPLIAILGNWGYLSRIYQLRSAPTEKPATGVLTLATYNVDSFGNETSGYTCNDIAGFMEGQNADILCFQEFGINKSFNVDSVRAAFSDWPYSFIPQDSVKLLQLALFSKYPIRESKLITYPDSKNCSLWCDLDINGKTIRVFCNHLQTTEVSQNRRRLEREMRKDEAAGRTEAAALRLVDGLHLNFIRRAQQAETVRSIIDSTSYPILVCGDLNSLPSSYTYKTIKGDKLKDGFQTCGHGYMYTFRYFKHLLRIDYIFHSPEFEGVDYFSPELEYSDHNPVVMRVKFATEPN